MNGEAIIDVRGMTKRFGDRTVVDHVDLTVRPCARASSSSALPDAKINSQASSLADGNNGWRWPRVSFTNRSCCYSTNRQPVSTQKRVVIFGMRFIISPAKA